MEFLGIASIPVITVIVFLVGEGAKAANLADKWIPVLCGVCGGILGIVARYVMPSFPGTDILSAIAIGIVSGLAATGAHQVYHQFVKAAGEQMYDQRDNM